MEPSATGTSAAAAAARRRQQRRVPNEKRKRAANALVFAWQSTLFDRLNADVKRHSGVPSAKRGRANAYGWSSVAASVAV